MPKRPRITPCGVDTTGDVAGVALGAAVVVRVGVLEVGMRVGVLEVGVCHGVCAMDGRAADPFGDPSALK